MVPYPKFDGFSRKLMTLTMIVKNDELLLGMKNRGMGKGKWNGFGGKVEPNETIYEGAIREVKEECGLDVYSMEKYGVIEFEYVGSKELFEGHIFLCNDFGGDIIESDEMAPIKWFKIGDTPCDTMWIDHKFWSPLLLKQIPFKAHFKYLNDDTMLDSTIILHNSKSKTKKLFVNVLIKKDNQLLVCKNVLESKYLNEHEEVKNGEHIEKAALRVLRNRYGIAEPQLQEIAVVNVELINETFIEEISFFIVDCSKLTISPQIEGAQWFDINIVLAVNSWLDNKFLSKLFMMKPFKTYFLMDHDFILFNKYYNN